MNQDSSPSNDILVQIQPTPNPNAWKFILDRPVLLEGKSTYLSPQEAELNPLAAALFQVAGVKQVHFFQNVITITQTFDADTEPLQQAVISVIQTRMAIHNPALGSAHERKQARNHLPPDLQKIEEILDRTVRPGLQGDGGDITVVKYQDHKLEVSYEGACGTCPSSTTGTLMAIESILKDEFDPQIEVVPV